MDLWGVTKSTTKKMTIGLFSTKDEHKLTEEEKRFLRGVAYGVGALVVLVATALLAAGAGEKAKSRSSDGENEDGSVDDRKDQNPTNSNMICDYEDEEGDSDEDSLSDDEYWDADPYSDDEKEQMGSREFYFHNE